MSRWKQHNAFDLAGNNLEHKFISRLLFFIFLKIPNKPHLRQNYSHTGTYAHTYSQKKGTKSHPCTKVHHKILTLLNLESTFMVLFEYYLLP